MFKKRYLLMAVGFCLLAIGWYLWRPAGRKVLLPVVLADDPAKRLALEALAHQIIHYRHPGVVEWLEFKKVALQGSEYYCLTSKWFSDESLKDWLKNKASFDEENVLLVIEHVAEVLGYLWDNCHIAHGNLKPRNILIDETGALRIDEFGLHVLLTLIAPKGLNIGTPSIMAPELKTGRVQPNPVSDIYALGMTVACLLAGSSNGTDVPLAGSAGHSQTNKKVSLSLSTETGEIIRRLTARAPEERFQSWQTVCAVVNKRVTVNDHDRKADNFEIPVPGKDETETIAVTGTEGAGLPRAPASASVKVKTNKIPVLKSKDTWVPKQKTGGGLEWLLRLCS